MENKKISKEEFLDIMSNYISNIANRNLAVEMELGVEYGAISMSPLIKLYVKEINRVIYLHENNINTALNEYADNLGYTLYDYKFIGGVRRMGIFVDEDTPYFDGIDLQLIKKNSVLKLNTKQTI